MAKASFQKISNLMTEKLRRKANQDFDLPDVTFRPRRANRRSATESDEVVRGGEKRMKRILRFRRRVLQSVSELSSAVRGAGAESQRER